MTNYTSDFYFQQDLPIPAPDPETARKASLKLADSALELPEDQRADALREVLEMLDLAGQA